MPVIRQCNLWMCITGVMIISFAYWFASHQVAVFNLPLASYPFPEFLLTLCKVSLYLILLFSLLQASLDGLCQRRFNSMRYALLLFPLVLVHWQVPLSVCCLLILSFSFLSLVPYVKVIAQRIWPYKIDCLVLVLFTFWYLFNAHVNIFSPLQWKLSLLTLRSDEVATTAQLYKSFIWAKQFSFSSMDYAQWAAIIHSPNSLNSPLLQLLALLLDAPSLDIKFFLTLVLGILFFLTVLGSFGFYLYLRYALKTTIGIAFIGGLLLLLGNAFVAPNLALDCFILLSGYLLFPWALLLSHFALKKQDKGLACWAGAALSAPFFFLSPHPEGTLYFGLLYLVMGLTSVGRRKEGLAILFISLISAIVLSAFHLGPIFWNYFQGNMQVIGHPMQLGQFAAIKPSIAQGLNGLYFYLSVISAGVLILLASLKPQPREIGGWIMLAAFIIVLAYINYFPLLAEIKVHLNLAAGHRIMLIFALIAITLFCLALDAIIKLIPRQFSQFILCIELLLVGYSVHALNHLNFPFTKNHSLVNIASRSRLENPNNCDYYIGLTAHLVNFQLLRSDTANLNFIRAKLFAFEQAIASLPDYQIQYEMLLHPFGIHSIHEATSAQIPSIALQTKSLVDTFYLNPTYHCVNPLLAHDNNAALRILRFNLDGLYANLSHPFMRVMNATDSESHLGLGAGLFIHNTSMTYDDRYIIAQPLLHALYLSPGYDFNENDQYHGVSGWVVSQNKLLQSINKKIADISGIDIFTLKSPTTREDLIPIPYTLPNLVNPNYFVYQNLNSYGTAYLANHLQLIMPETVKQDEAFLLKTFKSPGPLFQFLRDKYLAYLLALKHRHDVYVETNSMTVTNTAIPAGSVTIQKIMGERAAFHTNCNRENCLFVFNIAAVPGWQAFVNGIKSPIKRVNFAFMGVTVPKGKALVWFIYQSWADLFFYCFSALWFLGMIIRSYHHNRINFNL